MLSHKSNNIVINMYFSYTEFNEIYIKWHVETDESLLFWMCIFLVYVWVSQDKFQSTLLIQKLSIEFLVKNSSSSVSH